MKLQIMNKKILVIMLMFFVSCTSIIISCGDKQETEKNPTDKKTSKYKIGFVSGTAGLGDKAFNDMHFNGMVQARKQNGIDFIYTTPKDENSFKSACEELIAQGANVIFAGAGFYMVDTVDELSVKYPELFFIIDDIKPKTPRKNIASATYKQNEGSFLAGALAAMESKTGAIAFFGASDFITIKDFYYGYRAGARYINKNIKIYEVYIDDYLKEKAQYNEKNPFVAPRTTTAMALEMINNKNVDIIFYVAGSSSFGGFRAAEQTNTWAIGVDSNQDYLAQGFVLTSMMKNVDKGIAFLINELVNGRIRNENYVFGLKEDGVGLSPMEYSRGKIKSGSLKRIDEIKADIISKKIIVPSAF